MHDCNNWLRSPWSEVIEPCNVLPASCTMCVGTLAARLLLCPDAEYEMPASVSAAFPGAFGGTSPALPSDQGDESAGHSCRGLVQIRSSVRGTHFTQRKAGCDGCSVENLSNKGDIVRIKAAPAGQQHNSAWTAWERGKQVAVQAAGTRFPQPSVT